MRIDPDLSARLRDVASKVKFTTTVKGPKGPRLAGSNPASKYTALITVLRSNTLSSLSDKRLDQFTPTELSRFNLLLSDLEANPSMFPKLMAKYETLRFQAGDGN